MGRRAAGVWSATVVAIVAAGCRSHNADMAAAAPACEPVEGALAATVTADGWAGDYRLIMVATSGDSAGRSTSGPLRLQPQADSLRGAPGGSADDGTVMPMYGTTGIDLGAIGAVQVGDLAADDPIGPGVLVLERKVEQASGTITQITIRLGSDANRRGRVRFDGGYTALFVRQAGPGGFAGNWASGITGQLAAGHFCTERVTP